MTHPDVLKLARECAAALIREECSEIQRAYLSGELDGMDSVRTAILAIERATEAAGEFLMAESQEAANDECIRDAEVITECANALLSFEHLKGQGDA